MPFLCVQCDERFESDQEEPRCPKCMRKHGIQRLDVPKAQSGGRPAVWIGAGLTAALGLAALAYVALAPKDDAPAAASAALSELSKAGVDPGDLGALLVADDAIAAFAEATAGDEQGAVARAQAIVGGVRERAKQQAFVPWSMADPREGGPMNAAQAFAALEKAGARAHLYPLEVAAVAVAALRSLDVPAELVEVHGYPGDKAPLDPSGCIGYFGVGVRDESQGEALRVLDPYGGRTAEPLQGERSAVTDRGALAMALGVRALHDTVWNSEGPQSLKVIEAALDLRADSVSLRSVRAVVLAASGGVQEGEQGLETALQMRADAPRHNNMAAYRLQRGDVQEAIKHVTQALELAPEYAAARVVLAGVHMAQREQDLAKNELERAEGLDPDLPTLPLAWAQYFAMRGDLAEAVRRAEQGAALRPNQPHLQLNLGRLRRAAGDYDGMRRAAHRALELTPSGQREEMRQLIGAILGPTALEEADAEPKGKDAGMGHAARAASEGALGASADDDSFDLSRGSKLLGDQESTGDLRLGKSPRTLGLGGSKLDLKLDLGNK